ncbi:hypothetical protein GW17_00056203 [Ensete ventricosum]|nr:hypothetical protein GW17_00056203 [Ensete ventricosum]
MRDYRYTVTMHRQPIGVAPAGRSAARGHGRLRPVHRCDIYPRAQSLAAWCPQRGPTVGRPQGAAAHGEPYCQQGWRPLGRVAASGQG